MKKTALAFLLCLILVPSITLSASEPIPAGATSGTIQGKIVRVEADRIEVAYGSANDMTTIYIDRNTKINGSTPSTMDRVFGGILGEMHDLKPGDQVTANVMRNQQRLLAQSITTQAPTATSGSSPQGTSSPGSSSPAVSPETAVPSGRVCVRDERPNQQGQIVCGEVVR